MTQEENKEIDTDIKEFFEEIPKEEEKKEVKVLSIGALKKSGSFVDRVPVKKLVTWIDSESGAELTYDVFVRRQSYKTFSIFVENGEDVKDKVKSALMVSQCLASDETGKKDLLTYDQACDLEYNIMLALIQAVYEVNLKKK